MFWTHVVPGGDRTLRAEVIAGELYLSDSDGVEYDAETYLDETGRDVERATRLFFEQETAVAAGFDGGAAAAEENLTTFWKFLAARATNDRPLRIETFGNKFKQYKHYTGVDKTFNALVISSQKPKHIDLRHGRGTDPEIQKVVAAGKRFEEVMTAIVRTTERDNLASIGIYCRAGHHRSVACGELLKKHVYPLATVKHLTIAR